MIEALLILGLPAVVCGALGRFRGSRIGGLGALGLSALVFASLAIPDEPGVVGEDNDAGLTAIVAAVVLAVGLCAALAGGARHRRVRLS